MKYRLVFLASGRGSCFEAIVQAIQAGQLDGAEPVGLLCDKPGAPVLERAEALGVPSTLLAKESFRGPSGKWDRRAYDEQLERAIEALRPDWIVLAGYLLLLPAGIVNRWAGRILNIHPSLLPAFPGLRAQKQALDYGVRWTGCTVHLVTEALDAGPILEQSVLEVLPQDTEESLSQRLLPLEHQTYIRALATLCSRPAPRKP